MCLQRLWAVSTVERYGTTGRDEYRQGLESSHFPAWLLSSSQNFFCFSRMPIQPASLLAFRSPSHDVLTFLRNQVREATSNDHKLASAIVRHLLARCLLPLTRLYAAPFGCCQAHAAVVGVVVGAFLLYVWCCLGIPLVPLWQVMARISNATYDVSQSPLVMAMLWKRLNDIGKNWRHCYKVPTACVLSCVYLPTYLPSPHSTCTPSRPLLSYEPNRRIRSLVWMVFTLC